MSASPPPSFATTAERALALLGLCRPLMGSGSVGTMTVTANSGQFPTIPVNQFCFPLIVGDNGNTQVDYTAPFRVTATTPITDQGTTVPIASVLGGTRYNLAQNTQIIFYPAPANVNLYATVTAGGCTGGTLITDPNAMKKVVWFEDPEADGDLADNLLRAATQGSPTAVLTWSASPKFEKRGNMVTEQTDLWSFYVIAGRSNTHHLRGYQGLVHLDLLAALLSDAGSVDGALVSGRPIELVKRRRVQVAPGFYCYALDFYTFNGFQGLAQTNPEIFTQSAQATAWVKAHISMPSLPGESFGHPGDVDVLRGK